MRKARDCGRGIREFVDNVHHSPNGDQVDTAIGARTMPVEDNKLDTITFVSIVNLNLRFEAMIALYATAIIQRIQMAKML